MVSFSLLAHATRHALFSSLPLEEHFARHAVDFLYILLLARQLLPRPSFDPRRSRFCRLLALCRLQRHIQRDCPFRLHSEATETRRLFGHTDYQLRPSFL